MSCACDSRAALAVHDDYADVFKKELGVKGHLTRETAFNLSTIYREGGSKELARNVVEQYLTV
jgi:hypothetical protein